jgi:2-keto-4-pentenoate hydratase/2-oxohepta-3-ene-1,7-dioic acid hydratase in catechol pathway
MKIICIGRNYTEHIAELENEKPEEPVVFIKADSSILPKNQAFFIPPFSNDIHYEVELVVKINRLGKYIDKKFAHKYYSEIGLGIDFTARDLQSKLKAKGLPWEKAKSFDGSTLVSQKFINVEDFSSLNNISFSLFQNDTKVQQGTSAQMLWKIDELIAYVSQYFTLKIGDLIFTGTPAGVGRVAINDQLTGYIEDQKMFEVNIK